jgi:PAS domain-containing protein
MVWVSPERLSSVIGNIYAAAYDPGRWAVAIGDLENLFHGSKACFGRFGPNIQPNDIVATNDDPAFQLRYIKEHAHDQNDFADAVRAVPVGMVYRDHALVGGDTLIRSRLWNEWMAPQDMYGGIGCKVLESDSSYWFFDVQRGRGQDAFEAHELELLQTIVPHLARAADISRHFQSEQLLRSTFSNLSFGVILIDAAMRIATLNPAAESILLRPENGLLRKSGHLVATDAANMSALQRLVTQACSMHDDIIPGLGGDLLLRKTPHARGADLALSVGPLANSFNGISLVERHAVIFIREISLDLPSEFTEQVRALFDL